MVSGKDEAERAMIYAATIAAIPPGSTVRAWCDIDFAISRQSFPVMDNRIRRRTLTASRSLAGLLSSCGPSRRPGRSHHSDNLAMISWANSIKVWASFAAKKPPASNAVTW